MLPNHHEQTDLHAKPMSLYARLLQWLMFRTQIKNELAQWFTQPSINQQPAPFPTYFKTICRHAYTCETRQHRNRTVWVLHPTKAPTQKVVFYLHGGAYLYNLSTYHWRFLSRLCHHTQARVVVVDYPLTPTACCDEVYDFIESLYDEVTVHDQADHISIMGDSAGGALALGLAQQLRNKHKKQPTHIILFAPWLDATLTHPNIEQLEAKDPLLDKVALVKAGEAYKGHLDVKDPRVSPLYGDMTQLGRLSIFIGTHDLLWADCQKLHQHLQQQNIQHNYFEYLHMFHVWMMVVSLPESRRAMRQVVDLVLDHT